MNANTYYQTLLGYRDILDNRMERGLIGEKKIYDLTDKLNQWYEQAKRVEKAEREARISAKTAKAKQKIKE